MDGIDAVVVRFEPNTPISPLTPSAYTWLAAETYPLSDALTAALDQARQRAEHALDHDLATPIDQPFHQPWLQALDDQVTEAFADAALKIIEASGVDRSQIAAIASHGQTVAHRPNATPPISLQLADPQTIADRTGLTTVGRFRAADLAAHGQGAPLAPLLHQALFAEDDRHQVILNLGGIANVTCLIPDRAVVGFDTGPANALLDAHYRQHHDKPFDRDGRWARSGEVLPQLLARFLSDPFFQQPPPKSTSIETFGPAWLAQHLEGFEPAAPEDIQATLAELTAASVADALTNALTDALTDGSIDARPIDRVVVCGGGAHNLDLLDRLKKRLPGVAVGPIEAASGSVSGSVSGSGAVSADHLEAFLFAWLGRARLLGHAFDTAAITGAQRPVMLGEVHHPSADA